MARGRHLGVQHFSPTLFCWNLHMCQTLYIECKQNVFANFILQRLIFKITCENCCNSKVALPNTHCRLLPADSSNLRSHTMECILWPSESPTHMAHSRWSQQPARQAVRNLTETLNIHYLKFRWRLVAASWRWPKLPGCLFFFFFLVCELHANECN